MTKDHLKVRNTPYDLLELYFLRLLKTGAEPSRCSLLIGQMWSLLDLPRFHLDFIVPSRLPRMAYIIHIGQMEPRGELNYQIKFVDAGPHLDTRLWPESYFRLVCHSCTFLDVHGPNDTSFHHRGPSTTHPEPQDPTRISSESSRISKGLQRASI